MRLLSIYVKTLGDIAKPKLLTGYFLPLLAISMFMSIAIGNNQITAGAPLFQQEADLFASTTFMAYLLGVGMPMQAACAVFCALTIASEAEKGTLRILLSKPIKRWQLYVGTFSAIVTYTVLLGFAGLMLTSVLVFWAGDVDAAAIGPGILGAVPGALVFAVCNAVLVTAVGLAVAVQTKDRLRTALGGLAIPVLTFIFIPVQIFSGDVYEDYALYLIDLNYHFGHLFVFVYDSIGIGLNPQTQALLGTLSGVYEAPEGRGHLPETFPLTGHIPVELSVLILGAVGVGAFVFGLVRFRQIDV